MEQLGRPRWTKGHNREGEEFVRNVFHLVLPLLAGKQKSQLSLSWLRYEIAKVTGAASSLTAPQCLPQMHPRVVLTKLPPSVDAGSHFRCGGTADREETVPCSVARAVLSVVCDYPGT